MSSLSASGDVFDLSPVIRKHSWEGSSHRWQLAIHSTVLQLSTVVHGLKIGEDWLFYSTAAKETGQTVSESMCQVLHSICYAVVGGDLFLHMRSLCQQDKEAVKCKTKFPVLGILSLSSKARQRGVPRRGSSYTGRKVPVFLHTICIFKCK